MSDRPPSPEPEDPGLLDRITRRRALKWLAIGVGSTVGLAGAAGGGLLALRGCAPPVEGLKVLGDQDYRTFTNLVGVLIPPGGAFPRGGDPDRLARQFDGYLATSPEAIVDDLTLALDLVEFGPVLFDARAATFSNLEPAERASHWEGWATSDSLTRRKIALAFRKFVMLVFYDQPDAWEPIGYPGPFG